jgi:hypothetical protein
VALGEVDDALVHKLVLVLVLDQRHTVLSDVLHNVQDLNGIRWVGLGERERVWCHILV